MNDRDITTGGVATDAPAATLAPSELQLRMARNILEYLCQAEMNAGSHVTEQELVEEFGVSRSPVRAALSYLAGQGVVERQRNRGYFLQLDSRDLRQLSLDLPSTGEEKLLASIAEDWLEMKEPESFSESEFRRRYSLGRLAAARVLRKLSEDGIVSRNRGHGWRFEPTLRSPEARTESYAFRMIIEPAAIRAPSFELDRGLAELSRRNHELILKSGSEEMTSDKLSDIDTAFHRLIGVSSRNRFYLAAIERQNSLRRMMESVDWNQAHLIGSCVEHMEILAAIERGKHEEAAELMEHHLVSARNFVHWLQPPADAK